MYRKEIVYDRETRDYAMYLDSELVGFARTYHEAEVTLDQLVFELISGEFFREAPAETRALVAAPPLVFEAICVICEESKPESHFEANHAALICDECRANALPAAPTAHTISHTSDTFSGPETSTAAGREEPPPYLCPCLATGALCEACQEQGQPWPAPPSDPTSALVALCRAVIDEWIALGEQAITTPYDAALVQLARAMAPPTPRTLDHICGEALAYEYRKAPGAFLEKFDGFGAPRQAAVTHAVAAWLGVTVSEVDQLWLESRLRLGYENAARA